MKRIEVITNNTRGFLRNLFDHEFDNYVVEYNKNRVFEKKGTLKRRLLSDIVSISLFDYVGLYQVIRGEKKADLCFSFNRFAQIDKPYIIYLENPGALVHYCWNRPKHFFTKKRLKKHFHDSNLKAIICMSDACKNTLNKLYDLPEDIRVERIYPLINDDASFSQNDIELKFKKERIKCLFIAEYFRMKGGRDLIQLFKRIEENNLPYELTVITSLDGLDEYERNMLEMNPNIKLYDFVLSKKELNELYKESAILVNPTRWDSSSLVTLEAIKYGCTVIGTGIYAIKEMAPKSSWVYFKAPILKYWNDDNTINKDVAMHMNSTIKKDYIDEDLVEFMYEKMAHFVFNQCDLKEACKKSLELARNKDFGEEYIVNRWNEIFDEALKK